ncbi:acetyl esterase [Ureibacillus xyleni]|uniref:Acetyl esterase n=1 Tax=Ureibacillus xyleni TaxID=614648 RepID=A0A285SFJ9_9BACL|nr:alpha/beta hydrolase [Ureibacillus xyleni]SOC06130.1 acetyl esterase [Ureibacillus xyleni]
MPNLLLKTIQYLETVNQQPSLHTMTPEEVRHLRASALTTDKNSVTLSNIEDQLIEVRDGSKIKVRVYTPIGEGPHPIIIYYHGGGWVINSIETSDTSCQNLAALANSLVVSVDYRLAPEYKFPTPVNDAYDAFLWTVENAVKINGIDDQISVMGDSAGANLATVVTLMAKDFNGPSIASQILLYPVTDLGYDTTSYHEFAEGFGLERKDMQWFGKYYLNKEEEKEHPYVAPLKANDVTGLPPALIIVAENDVLRDEGIAYSEKLKDANVSVKQLVAKGLVHSFFTKNDVFSSEIEKTIVAIHSFLKETVKPTVYSN